MSFVEAVDLNRGLKIASVISILLIAVVSGGIAADDQESASMDVTVNSKTIISLTPNSASFSGDPGATSGIWTNFSLENKGSTNITGVYANVTQPNTDPFGSADPTAFDAGNLIGIRNSSSGPLYMVDRKEFNRTQASFVTKASGCDINASGRIRMDNEEFFYCVDGGVGNYSNGTLYVSDKPHNSSQTGDVDLSDNTGNTLQLESGTSYGATDVEFNTGNAPSTNETYCVAVNADGSWVKFTHWNTDIDKDGHCTNDKDLMSGKLQPSEAIDLEIRARIPYGTTEGSLSQGTLKLLATKE